MSTDGAARKARRRSIADRLANGALLIVGLYALVIGGKTLLGARGAGAAMQTSVGDDLVEVPNWPVIASGGHELGPPDAPVRIVEFSDFQCPYCARIQPLLKDAVQRHWPRVTVVYRHFPLEKIHPHALGAALASECAAEQGRFREYHDTLFERQDEIGTITWSEIAIAAGVSDTALFATCVNERRHQGRVTADVNAAALAGVRGTPTLVINGRVVASPVTMRTLDRIIGSLSNGAQP